jgi:hypothetical protein
LQDKCYRDKLQAYATENVLAQTLCEAFHQNNPNVATYLSVNKSIDLSPINDFAKCDISKRASAYLEVAQKVWAAP